jgi:SAM-dependent methyltransferase
MFAFLLRDQLEHRDGALVSYFRSGWSAARTVLALREQWQQLAQLPAPLRILDFAGGYGRSTRFLVREHDPAAITVCDILPDAVEFQRTRFGVTGALSATAPEDLELDGPFDLIFVGSLFSHLPERSFGRWLARLAALLSPRGLLAITTHDQSLMLPGREMPDSGLYFEAMSDLGERLELADYGSAWVSPGFVDGVIDRLLGPSMGRRRISRGAWSYQDLWLISHEVAPLAELDVPLEPQMFLEQLHRTADRRLLAAGWVADIGAGQVLPRVELLVDSRTAASATPTGLRPDVSQMLAIDEARPVGFEIEIELERPLDATQIVTLRATTAAGVVYVGHCDALASSELLASLRRAQFALDRVASRVEGLEADLATTAAERDGLTQLLADAQFVVSCREYELGIERSRTAALEAQIAAMQASRFWKLREWWFRLKRALGQQG